MFGQLDCVYPFGDFQLPGLYEEDCQSSEELLLVNIFYSNSRHCAATALLAREKWRYSYSVLEYVFQEPSIMIFR